MRNIYNINQAITKVEMIYKQFTSFTKITFLAIIIFSTSFNSFAQTSICFSIESETEQEISSGTMSTTSSDLELGEDGGTTRLAGLRYTNFNIPANAIINNATIQFTADETSNTTANLTIKGELTGNANSYNSNSFNLSNRTTTSASVSWQPQQWTAIGAAGAAQKTPDISSVVSEIIANPSFVSGNAISFIISGTGTRTAENAPIDLCITYTTCGSPGQSCNDNSACTVNDVWDSNCNCAGTPNADADNDGICDAEDQCPNFDDNLIGTSCNDNNANTINDIWQANCSCLGNVPAFIRINEILTSNQGSVTNLLDEDGDSPDYIELYNTENYAVDLSNWKLLDGDNIWKIPAGTTISANGFLSIWASGKNRSTPQLHSNFELSSKGEYLGLYDDFDNLVHDFGAAYPSQSDNISYGYTANNNTSYFNTVTKNANNTNATLGKVATPQAAIGRGFYTSTVFENISSATPNAIIRYTTDGTEPSFFSSVLNGNITINPDATGIFTIRAKAYLSGYEDSDEISWSYVFPDALYTGQAADGLASLPVISVQTNSQNYPGGAFGSPVPTIITNVEMVEIDISKTGFSVIAGINEFGESSTDFDKSSLRLYFDNEYGVSDLEYDVFDGYGQGYIKPTKQFDKLELRGMSWDGWQGDDYFPKDFYITDRWWKDCRLDMGELNPHGRYTNLFVNGEYRGVYQLRERFDHQFYASYADEPAENFEALKYNLFPSNNNPTEYFVNGTGTVYNSLNQNYQNVKNWVNAKSLINHAIMMSLSTRSPEFEYRGVGTTDPNSTSGYIFMHNDNDFMFHSPFEFGGYDPTYHVGDFPFFETYRSDQEFLQDVYEETAKHFCGGGAMTINKMLERLNYWESEIDLAMYSEARRWQGQSLDGSIPNTNTGIYTHWKDNMTAIKNRINNSTNNLYNAWAAQGLYRGCDLRPQVDTENQISERNRPVSYFIDATDPDGDAMSFSSNTLPPGLSINSSTGEISGTPFQSGTFNVTVRVSDSNNKWGNHTFVWEVINLNQPTGGQLIINEIHYNPLDSILTSGGEIDDDNFEFIEVKNIGTADMILYGNVFTKGIDLNIANPLRIPPNGFAVFAKDSCWFEAKYGFFPDAQYKNKLDNGGEYLRLKGPYKSILDSLTYDDNSPWDDVPDGGEYSLAYIPGSNNTSNPANWAAQVIPVTPRAENNFCAPIQVNEQIANISCNGNNDGFIASNVTGGTAPLSYSWSNGATSSVIQSLAPGTYVLTTTDFFKCTKVDSFTINEPTALAAVISSIDESLYQANDGSAQVTVNGGTAPYTYSWSNGASTSSINNLAPGNYTVDIMDMNGCSFSDSVIIDAVVCTINGVNTITANSSITNASNSAANDGAIDLVVNSNGTPPYTFQWSNGATTEDLNNIPTGTYNVSITDGNGCNITLNNLVVESDCLASIVQQNNAAINSQVYQVAQFIQSNGMVNTNEQVSFKAGDYIELIDDFEVIQGAEFEALIDGCN